MALRRVPSAIASLVFIALFCIAVYDNVFNNHRHLPVPVAAKVLSLLLPILQLLGCFAFFASAKVDVFLVANVGYIFSLLDVVLITIAALYHSSQPLECTLEEAWQKWFSDKNVKAIESVQDRLQCCGFKSLRDRAWPFPSKKHDLDVDACIKQFDRHVSCFPQLVKAAHRATTFFIIIGCISLGVKMFASWYWQLRFPAWSTVGSTHHHRRTGRHRTALIQATEEQVQASENYTDEEPGSTSAVARRNNAP